MHCLLSLHALDQSVYLHVQVTPLSDLPEAHDEVDVVGVVSHITSDSVVTAK